MLSKNTLLPAPLSITWSNSDEKRGDVFVLPPVEIDDVVEGGRGGGSLLKSVYSPASNSNTRFNGTRDRYPLAMQKRTRKVRRLSPRIGESSHVDNDEKVEEEEEMSSCSTVGLRVDDADDKGFITASAKV